MCCHEKVFVIFGCSRIACWAWTSSFTALSWSSVVTRGVALARPFSSSSLTVATGSLIALAFEPALKSMAEPSPECPVFISVKVRRHNRNPMPKAMMIPKFYRKRTVSKKKKKKSSIYRFEKGVYLPARGALWYNQMIKTNMHSP